MPTVFDYELQTKGRMTNSLTPQGDEDYRRWLTELKQRVELARARAAASVNRELVTLYWQIGSDILERQERQGWGAKVIDRLAQDLKAAFPDMRGFSPRNLKYMRALAQAWPSSEFVQQPAAQLPWFHLCTLLDKAKTRRSAIGTLARRLSTAGPATFSRCKLTRKHMRGRVRP